MVDRWTPDCLLQAPVFLQFLGQVPLGFAVAELEEKMQVDMGPGEEHAVPLVAVVALRGPLHSTPDGGDELVKEPF